MNGDIYLNLVLKEMPRLLSLLDRNAHSPTFGCFDRGYWRYKTTDHPNARLQEACYTLALLYKDNHPHRWHGDKKIMEYSLAAMDFWSRQQNSDGSFNEYLPKEHSHVATAFSAYAIASAYAILNLKDESILTSLEKASKWLNKNDDLVVVNHDASTIPTFYLMFLLSKKNKYLKYCKEKLKKVLKNQDQEGWFSEYGGADIGYQSYSIYYLAKYFELSGDKKVLEPLSKALDFFSYFIHPDYSIGGHYGSRETSFIIPAGFEILSEKIDIAKSISSAIREALDQKKIAGPYSFDDRFLAEELYVYLDLRPKIPLEYVALPKDKENFMKFFRSCGLYVQKTSKFYLIFNTKRGGICKIFKNGNLAYGDSGWVTKRGNTTLTTNGPSEAEVNGGEITIKGNFFRVNFRYQTPTTTVILRFLNALHLQNKIKRILREKMISEYKRSSNRFTRRLKIEDEKITIVDKFDFKDLNKLYLTHNFSFIYSTSLGLYEEKDYLPVLIVEDKKKETRQVIK